MRHERVDWGADSHDPARGLGVRPRWPISLCSGHRRRSPTRLRASLSAANTRFIRPTAGRCRAPRCRTTTMTTCRRICAPRPEIIPRRPGVTSAPLPNDPRNAPPACSARPCPPRDGAPITATARRGLWRPRAGGLSAGLSAGAGLWARPGRQRPAGKLWRPAARRLCAEPGGNSATLSAVWRHTAARAIRSSRRSGPDAACARPSARRATSRPRSHRHGAAEHGRGASARGSARGRQGRAACAVQAPARELPSRPSPPARS